MQASDPDIRFAEFQVNLACFEVHGQLYALDVQHVKEIVRCQDVTPLPRAPRLIEGVIDLRGSVIPVLDLGRALGGAPVKRDSAARIVVIECNGLSLGLCVAAAVDVLSLPPSALEDPPTLTAHAAYETVQAVVRREGGSPVMVLSLEHLLETVHASAPASAASEPGDFDDVDEALGEGCA